MKQFEEPLGPTGRLFEQELHQDLHQFLQSMKEIDARLPECPDVEEKWEQIAKAYIPDGIREFNDFPSASLGWMMYIGMAVVQGVDYSVLEKVTGECASRVYNALMHQRLEPGTREAFNAYVACLHLLYLFGAAMQLKRMGYHMTKMS